MKKKHWVLVIIIFLGLGFVFDYAQYNTDIRTLSMMSDWPEEELKARIPYKPFIPLNVLTEYIVLPW